MPDPGQQAVYPSVDGLRIGHDGEGTIQCRYIRGLENPTPGGPDLVLDGDSLVSLHVDTNPPFADSLAAQLRADDPVVRFDGVTMPRSDGLVPVFALSRPRAKLTAGEDADLLIAAWMAEEELADWELLRNEPCEVQITVDTSARPTRRMTIQFSWTRAEEHSAPGS